LLNDRIIINGNVDLAGNETDESNIVGDFDVEYKITKSGKLRVKAYHRTNDRIYDYSPHTQGIGLFYREEFSSFSQLFEEYWNSLFGKDSTKIN
jgi:hypothetical protein